MGDLGSHQEGSMSWEGKSIARRIAKEWLYARPLDHFFCLRDLFSLDHSVPFLALEPHVPTETHLSFKAEPYCSAGYFPMSHPLTLFTVTLREGGIYSQLFLEMSYWKATFWDQNTKHILSYTTHGSNWCFLSNNPAMHWIWVRWAKLDFCTSGLSHIDLSWPLPPQHHILIFFSNLSRTGLANDFYKGPDGQCFRLCKPYGLGHSSCVCCWRMKAAGTVTIYTSECGFAPGNFPWWHLNLHLIEFSCLENHFSWMIFNHFFFKGQKIPNLSSWTMDHRKTGDKLVLTGWPFFANTCHRNVGWWPFIYLRVKLSLLIPLQACMV